MEDDGNPHYYRCDKIDGGCGAMFAKSDKCFFVGLYLLNRQGEIIGYIKKQKRRRIIKTDKILPDKPGWYNEY